MARYILYVEWDNADEKLGEFETMWEATEFLKKFDPGEHHKDHPGLSWVNNVDVGLHDRITGESWNFTDAGTWKPEGVLPLPDSLRE